VYHVDQTDTFRAWLAALSDLRGQAKINIRIKRMEQGNFGVVEPVGEGISELKIDFGPGYRVYYKQTGRRLLLLLIGGDKSTQMRDIKRAKEIAKSQEGENGN
jgi:putative addiction module killer protein